MAKDMKLGATGEFPLGKLGPDDEGALNMAITAAKGKVIVNFGTPVRWFAVPPEAARQLAKLFLHHADKAESHDRLD